jgi:hypothetical protein
MGKTLKEYSLVEREKCNYYRLSHLAAISAVALTTFLSPLEMKEKDKLLRESTGVNKIPKVVNDYESAKSYFETQFSLYEKISREMHPPYYSSKLIDLLTEEHKGELERVNKRLEVVLEDMGNLKDSPEYKEYQLAKLAYDSQRLTNNVPRRSMRIFTGLAILAGLSHLMAKRKEKELKQLIPA